MARFRVNVFIQRGSCAIVMRVIPTRFQHSTLFGCRRNWKKPQSTQRDILVTEARVGQVLDAGRVDRLDQQRILLSRPDGGRSIEFLHKHKRSTVHQRELHSDAPNFTLALRAALRQAPRVIMVGKSATTRRLRFFSKPPKTATSFFPA